MEKHLSKTLSRLPSLVASAVLLIGIGYHGTAQAKMEQETLLASANKPMQLAYHHGYSRGGCCVAPQYYQVRYYNPAPVVWPFWGPFYGVQCQKSCYVKRHGTVVRCVRTCY